MELEPATATLTAMFLGEDLLAWLVLALGGALFVGNVLAVLRPPAPSGSERATTSDSPPVPRAPVARSLVMGAVGFVAAIWALGSLISG